MKILHSADWHLDAPMTGYTPEQTELLRRELHRIPDRIAKLCQAEGCDLLILAGDLFDGQPGKDSVAALKTALGQLSVPVIITPGNHDFLTGSSVYEAGEWPKNVHIFKKAAMEALELPELCCTVYGAGYESMECPGLMKSFHIQGDSRWHIGVLHGDPNTLTSPYCPVTKAQIQNSGLSYLAMGHIHKGGSFRAGETLCAWPGCPMGRGFDELGPKGVILVTLEDTVKANFLPLDTPRFYDEEEEAGDHPEDALAALLPAVDSSDFYRITLTGYSAGIDLNALKKQFPHIPNLELRDATIPEMDLWSTVGEDSLEGVCFGLLHDAAGSESEVLSRRAKLAARICRRILDGQEVKLP